MTGESASDWDRLFDELYLRTYAPLTDPEAAPRQAEAIVRWLELAPGTKLLDCPCGFGRHSIAFAGLGLHVVGAERSPVLLAEARRRAGDGEWPQLVQADYRELPFGDASFDCVTNLFTSLGYWGEEADRRALAEFRRVLRPGGAFVLETMHRDRVMAIYSPKSWEDLPGGGVMIEERTFDYERGEMVARHELVEADGTRVGVPYRVRTYTVTELLALVREAGFRQVSSHGDFDDHTPVSRDTRAILLGR